MQRQPLMVKRMNSLGLFVLATVVDDLRDVDDSCGRGRLVRFVLLAQPFEAFAVECGIGKLNLHLIRLERAVLLLLHSMKTFNGRVRQPGFLGDFHNRQPGVVSFIVGPQLSECHHSVESSFCTDPPCGRGWPLRGRAQWNAPPTLGDTIPSYRYRTRLYSLFHTKGRLIYSTLPALLSRPRAGRKLLG